MTEFEKAYHETLKHAEWCGQSQFICTSIGEEPYDLGCKECPLRTLPSCKSDFTLTADGWKKWWNETIGGHPS